VISGFFQLSQILCGSDRVFKALATRVSESRRVYILLREILSKACLRIFCFLHGLSRYGRGYTVVIQARSSAWDLPSGSIIQIRECFSKIWNTYLHVQYALKIF
jgi:hypothetical protein